MSELLKWLKKEFHRLGHQYYESERDATIVFWELEGIIIKFIKIIEAKGDNPELSFEMIETLLSDDWKKDKGKPFKPISKEESSKEE